MSEPANVSAPGVGGIVLAAGESARLRRDGAGPKQLLLYRGQTLLRRAIDTALQAGLDPVVVVLGAHAETIRPTLAGLRVSLVENVHWERGMGGSLRAGLAGILEISPGLEAVMLMVCDQPLVDAPDLRELAAAKQTTGKGLAAAAYGDALGVPALVDRAYFSALGELPDHAGAKALFFRFADDVARVPLPHAGVDVDDAAAYAALLSRPAE